MIGAIMEMDRNGWEIAGGIDGNQEGVRHEA